MGRPNTLGEMIAVVAGGNGNHGSFHVHQLVNIGVGTIIITDPSTSKFTPRSSDSNIIPFRGTLAKYLDGENLPLHLVIDASPDEHHISNMGLLVKHGNVGVICSEKPVANTAVELGIFRDLERRANDQKIQITTCLPRIMDAPYMELKNMIRGLISQYGSITHIRHTCEFYSSDKNISIGRSQHAHEISLVFYLLNGLGSDKVRYEDIENTPGKYTCRGRIGSVAFEVGGNRLAEIPSEIVEITFFKGEITTVHLDAKTGKITIQQDEQCVEIKNVRPSNPAHRLTAVTQRLVDMALGGQVNYLSPIVQKAAIEGPATLFGGQ